MDKQKSEEEETKKVSRNQKSNGIKAVAAQCNYDVLYIVYAIFAKKALSSALYHVLKHMGLVKNYAAYKRLLNGLENDDLIKRRTIEVFDKYNKDEEVILKQFSIDYIAKSLGESPVAVSQTRTAIATIQRAAKVLYILQWRADKIAEHGIKYWQKFMVTTTFFVPPNKTTTWLNWFNQYLQNHFNTLPEIEQSFANLCTFYSNETQKFNKNLRIGSESKRNKGQKSNASTTSDEDVDLKNMVVKENVRKKTTKDNLLDDITLHKVLNNHIYLSASKARNVASTGKKSSPVCFNVVIFESCEEATLRSYLLKLAYVHHYITEELLLGEYDVPFDVEFVTMESHQAENLKESLDSLRPEALERYGLMMPIQNKNVRIKTKSLNLRQLLQKK